MTLWMEHAERDTKIKSTAKQEFAARRNCFSGV
jgi:hypothetical protein